MLLAEKARGDTTKFPGQQKNTEIQTMPGETEELGICDEHGERRGDVRGGDIVSTDSYQVLLPDKKKKTQSH